MPTVTDIADYACQLTGLDTTGSDRALILGWVNDANLRATMRARTLSNKATFSLTEGVTEYDIPTIASDILDLRHVTLTDLGISNRPLALVDELQMLEWAESSSAYENTPEAYTVVGMNTLMVWPPPNASTSITLRYYASPNELVETSPAAGQETTPTSMRAPFHLSIIGNGAVALAHQYDQRVQGETMAYWQMFDAGVSELDSLRQNFAGTQYPPIRNSPSRRWAWPRDRDVR